jgi:polar amino acid transport system substrate-binding protein
MEVKMILAFLLLFLVATPLVAAPPLVMNLSSVALDNITYYTENYPPANYSEDGELKGISIDTLKALWKSMNRAERKILMVPWSRGYRFTLDSPNTALLTMSRTPAREHLFKWVGPLFNSTHVLIAKRSKNYNFTNLGQIFSHNVVAVQGDISEISLQQVGFPAHNMAKVAEQKQGFLMLESDRVDMLAVSIHGFYHLAKEFNIDQNDYEQVWTLNKIGNYIAFNNNTSDSLISSYQQAFNNIEAERIKIKKRYELPIEEY